MADRKVTSSFPAAVAHDGDGVDLHRAFPGTQVSEIDPFLLLDELGPTDLAPGAARGFPPHPHRGFETVTYLLSGEMQHRDSWGNHGVLRAGDVQWMTAGSGLIHSELPGEALVRDGGRLHGFQLWVNLPRRDKMLKPRYQDTAAATIPIAVSPDGTVRVKVIAGEAMGVRGVIDTRIPILYLHPTLKPGAEFVQAVPKNANTFLYIVSGIAKVGDARLEAGQIALLDRSGETIRIGNSGKENLSLLVISGEPIGESVMRYGPFVMNSKDEIVQAIDDYRNGRMGTLD
jgi:redox-sensitive bicupin YhaK (pirin superfamily)